MTDMPDSPDLHPLDGDRVGGGDSDGGPDGEVVGSGAGADIWSTVALLLVAAVAVQLIAGVVSGLLLKLPKYPTSSGLSRGSSAFPPGMRIQFVANGANVATATLLFFAALLVGGPSGSAPSGVRRALRPCAIAVSSSLVVLAAAQFVNVVVHHLYRGGSVGGSIGSLTTPLVVIVIAAAAVMATQSATPLATR